MWVKGVGGSTEAPQRKVCLEVEEMRHHATVGMVEHTPLLNVGDDVGECVKMITLFEGELHETTGLEVMGMPKSGLAEAAMVMRGMARRQACEEDNLSLNRLFFLP